MNLIPAQMSAEGVIADRAGRLRPVLEETRQATETLLNMARMWREDEPATAALRRLDERVALLENKLEEAQEKAGQPPQPKKNEGKPKRPKPKRCEKPRT